MRKGCEKINSMLQEAKKKKGLLIAAHRGTCGHYIIENTTDAFACAMRQTADVMELDVAPSSDGELFVFHDGNEKRLLGADRNLKTMKASEILSYQYKNNEGMVTKLHVNTFDEVLDFLKGKCLINLDRCQDYLEAPLKKIEEHGMVNQVTVKTDPEDYYFDWFEKQETPYMYAPKMFNSEAGERLFGRNINTVAFECIFQEEDSSVINPEFQQEARSFGIQLWCNTLRLKENWNRCAWHDDNLAILEGGDKAWGWLIDHGIECIMTDWPLMLRYYYENEYSKKAK